MQSTNRQFFTLPKIVYLNNAFQCLSDGLGTLDAFVTSNTQHTTTSREKITFIEACEAGQEREEKEKSYSNLTIFSK